MDLDILFSILKYIYKYNNTIIIIENIVKEILGGKKINNIDIIGSPQIIYNFVIFFSSLFLSNSINKSFIIGTPSFFSIAQIKSIEVTFIILFYCSIFLKILSKEKQHYSAALDNFILVDCCLPSRSKVTSIVSPTLC